MRSYAVALVIALLAGLSLSRLAFPGATGEAGPATPPDESLVYEVPGDGSLDIRVPASLDAIVMTTWAVLRRASCDPLARYEYAVNATLVDQLDQDVGVHRFDVPTRRSCDAHDSAESAARLVGSDEPVSDPRTIIIPITEILQRGGVLRLARVPGAANRVLARIHGRTRRSEGERFVYQMALTPEARHKLVEHRVPLGFGDLPWTSKVNATSDWLRKLDAIGREGESFRLERLVFTDFRTPFPTAAPPVSGFVVGKRHHVAFNFAKEATLRLEGIPGQEVVADGITLRLGEDGLTSLTVDKLGPHTLVLAGTGDDVSLRSHVSMAEASARIGDVTVRLRRDGRAEIAPDVRYVRYAKLHPALPVVSLVAPGQQILMITVRGLIDVDDPREEERVKVWARFGSKPGDQASTTVVLRRSRFERWGDGVDATDPYQAMLTLPPWAESVEIFGDSESAVELKTFEPGARDILKIPYQMPLREHEVWRYAPFDSRSWTLIAPSNLEDLRREDRLLSLHEQVRIEQTGPGSDAGHRKLPERVLNPEGTPVKRRFFDPELLAPGAAFPERAYTPLPTTRHLVVPATGPRAGRLRVLYRIPADRLGATAVVRVDGEVVAREVALLTSGSIDVKAAPGARAVTIEWQAAAGHDGGRPPMPPGPAGDKRASSARIIAYADVAPEGGGAIVRERDVFQLRPGAPLTMSFEQREGELDHIVLFVVSEGGSASWRIRYQIDSGPRSLTPRFFRRATRSSDVLSGEGREGERGWLWETQLPVGAEMPDAVGKARIDLGDDHGAGQRKVRIELLSSAAPLWVRAVLVGQSPGARQGDASVWVEETP